MLSHSVIYIHLYTSIHNNQLNSIIYVNFSNILSHYKLLVTPEQVCTVHCVNFFSSKIANGLLHLWVLSKHIFTIHLCQIFYIFSTLWTPKIKSNFSEMYWVGSLNIQICISGELTICGITGILLSLVFK